MSNSILSTFVPIRIKSTGLPSYILINALIKGDAQVKVDLPVTINVNTPRMNVITKILNNGGFYDEDSGTLYCPVDYIPEVDRLCENFTNDLRAAGNDLVGLFPEIDPVTGAAVLDSEGNPVVVNRYEQIVNKTLTNVDRLINDNKKKSLRKKIYAEIKRKMPCREQFLLVGVKAYYGMPSKDVFVGLPANTQAILNESKEEQDAATFRAYVSSKCENVIECLVKFQKQIASGFQLNGKTITAYLEAINGEKGLKVANETLKFSEIDAFCSISTRVIDNPAEYVDQFINCWCLFYYQNGMLDNFPYKKANLSREELVEIVKIIDYSFSTIG